MIHKYPWNVDDAVKLLDVAVPGWADKINLDTLSMSSSENCVLGQLFGRYVDGMQRLFAIHLPPDNPYSADIIFGTTASTIYWKDEIKKRIKEKEYNTEGLAIRCFAQWDKERLYPHHGIFIRIDGNSLMLICETHNRFSDVKIGKNKITKSELEQAFGIVIFEIYPAKIKFEKR